MPTGLVIAGVWLLVMAGVAATQIEKQGPWATIVMAGAGLLIFLTGIVLRVIERK